MASGSAPNAPSPCSSNGDAAASLAAMLEVSKPLADETDVSDNAVASSATVSSGVAPEDVQQSQQQEEQQQPPDAKGEEDSQDKLAGDKDAWRLKFLHRVGIPPSRSASFSSQEAPAELGRPISPASSTTSLDDAASLDSVPVVVAVRQKEPRRSADDIRLGYIKKLERSRAFIPQLNRPKSSQTVTIFDWDDTLLCTSHLEMVQRQYGAIPAQVREQLQSLERIVKVLLQQAIKNGKPFIITNASEGWVQHSASLCMPGLQEDLAQIEIISARSGFEASFPGDSHAWKMHAFLQVQNKLQLEAVTNLISVGDSHIEMDAVHLLGRSFAHALVKTVKLWERPTPYELQKQLEVVADKLPDIYRAGTTLNIWLERETAQAS